MPTYDGRAARTEATVAIATVAISAAATATAVLAAATVVACLGRQLLSI